MKTYKDIYKLPLRKAKYNSWVYDKASNFVFQFEPKWDSKGNYEKGWEKYEQDVLDCLNGGVNNTEFDGVYTHVDGRIYMGIMHVMTIRGWGNLTGIGAHNLPAEEAANIQDTFAELIVNTLNK